MDDTPDSLTITAYLDGRLDRKARAAVERWLAASPEAVDLLLSVRRSLASPSPAAPEGLLRRAAGLVETDRAPTVAAVRPWQGLYWPSAAAMLVLSCLLGFQLARFAVTEAAAEDADVEVVFDLDMDGGSPL